MTEFYQGYLDNSFDSAFEALGLPWLPWVGSQYRDADVRTIVLGESIYLYGPRDKAEENRQKILQRDSLRRRQMNHGILAKIKSRYLRNFERAVFLKSKPSNSDRVLLWSRVMYHNLVPILLSSRKARPQKADYAKGWEMFLKMAEVVQPQRCIVYGLEDSKIDALREVLVSKGLIAQKRKLSAVGRHKPLVMTLSLPTGPLDLLFIRHPSAFFGWKSWGQVLRDSELMPVTPAGNLSTAA